MKTEELLAWSEQNIMGTYKRFPVVLVEGKGAKVRDSNGKVYLDFVAGIAVCSLGHSHPKVVEAIKKQADRLTHVSNLYHIEPQIRFAHLVQVELPVHGGVADEGVLLARRLSASGPVAQAPEVPLALGALLAHETLLLEEGEVELRTSHNWRYFGVVIRILSCYRMYDARSSHMWQVSRPFLCRYFWWYSSALQNGPAFSTRVAIGLLNRPLASLVIFERSAVERCSSS